MIDDQILATAKSQLSQLKYVVTQSERRTTGDPVDELFYDYQNVFVKAYLVASCSILESFIQELAIAYMELMGRRLELANIPLNFANWAAENDKARPKFCKFELRRRRSDISDLISPNYHKTVIVFSKIGVNLEESDEIRSFKDYISSTIDKRNKIVHHNDDASDLSFLDIINTIDEFTRYSEHLMKAVRLDQHLATA